MNNVAFVGDIHGNPQALMGLWNLLVDCDVEHVVFLGDYINKGPDSYKALDEVIRLQREFAVTLLAGNHEVSLLDALERGDLSSFLKMGGAATILSYTGGPVGPDVLSEFRASIPQRHLDALRAMPERFDQPDVGAQHLPGAPRGKYEVSAHRPVGRVPVITQDFAHIDTGCGEADGLLTALIWPDRTYIQVNSLGESAP